MVRFPNAAQRRQRALIKAVSVRSLQSIAIALFICFYAPLIAFFIAAVSYWSGLIHTNAQAMNIVNAGCGIARATVQYAFLCGSN